MALTQAQALMLLPLVEQGDPKAIGKLLRAMVEGDLTTPAGITATADEINTLDGITASTAELNLLEGAGAVVASGTQVANQGDLSTSADGTAIAAAVDGLRDALVAFGIMAEAS